MTSSAISFVGISNWNIDASKQNRNLYLVRPEPDADDLQLTANDILAKAVEDFDNYAREHRQSLGELVEILAESYVEFRGNQERDFPHPSFHTLRDFYWLNRRLAWLLNSPDEGAEAGYVERSVRLAIKSISINFSGIYKIERNAPNHNSASPDRPNDLTHSSTVFLRMFRRRLQQSERFRSVNDALDGISTETDKFSMVAQSLWERHFRYQMLFVENQFTFEHLIARLRA